MVLKYFDMRHNNNRHSYTRHGHGVRRHGRDISQRIMQVHPLFPRVSCAGHRPYKPGQCVVSQHLHKQPFSSPQRVTVLVFYMCWVNKETSARLGLCTVHGTALVNSSVAKLSRVISTQQCDSMFWRLGWGSVTPTPACKLKKNVRYCSK